MWIGLDPGLRRTGLAESDAQGIMAFPVAALATSNLAGELTRRYGDGSGLQGIALGNPQRLDGGVSQGAEARDLIAKTLRALWPDVPVHLVDERLTSKLAAQGAALLGRSKAVKKDKGQLDAAAASLILENFLHQKK
ncbi:MAG: Holliday junction resolvase RuvX [Cryomorphaceae bacterium]|jgi:putative Holliday junction resolvase|nr:Holliday junction resolvase RuvX [Cryomorphaceae bacterium]